jgi:alpha-L-rhamnosidase
MHETYEDCPFYEQNQFAMDTRTQILLTYLLSRDDRLARKTMREFFASRREDGLVETHFPNPGRSINIPTSSLFWVLMIWDHMVHFGDARLVRAYVGAVDGVLDYFDARIGALGLVGQFDEDCWAFVDWVDGWATSGKGFTGLAVPKAYYSKGSATYHSLLYAYTLLKASELATFLGRKDTAAEYRRRQEAIVTAVRTHCFDPATGFFLDGPDATGELSQHVQVFAVLSGCVAGEEARDLMLRTVLHCERHNLAKASFALGFYVFRAVSLAGAYEECWATLIAPWEKMIGLNLTTWAESDSMERSDCHGWSATPLYEIGTEIVGVKQYCRAYLETVKAGRDEAEVQVAPKPNLVDDIQATMVVGDNERDTIQVGWGKEKQLCVKSEGVV